MALNLQLVLPLRAQLEIRCANPVMQVEGGTVAQLLFHVYNNSRANTQASLLFSGPFKPINRIADTVIHAGDSLLVVLRLYIPRKTSADSLYVHTLRAASANGGAAASVTLRVAPLRMVQLTALQPEIFVQQRRDSMVLRVRCSNPGNQSATVILQLEDAMQQRKLGSQTLRLAGFTDTLLDLRMRLPEGSAPVILKGGYASGEIFSLQHIPLYQARSGSRYNAPWDDSPGGHRLGFYSRFMGTRAGYYEMLAMGAGKNISYQANALWYRQAMQERVVVMNTYAKLLTGPIATTVGSIFKTEEYMLAGRGAELAFVTPQTRLEAGVVNGNYNLVGNFEEAGYRYSNAVYLNYDGGRKGKWQPFLQGLQQWDGGAGVNNWLGGGGFRWHPGTHHSIQVKGYTSYSTTAPYKTDTLHGWGAAAGLDYNGRFGKWQLSAMNYLSTPRYAGLQKGAVNLDERLSFAPNHRHYLWLRYSRISYRPDYIAPLYRHYPNDYLSETAELGWQYQMGENWSLTLRPYYYREYMRNATQAELSSVRGNVQLMYNGALSFSLNAEGASGRTNVNGQTDFTGFRVMGFLQYKGAGLTAIAQHGPFYSGEVNQMQYSGLPYRMYTIGPGYSGRLFRGRLTLSLYDYLTYSNFYRSWEHNLTARAGIALPHGFQVEGGMMVYRYAGTNVTTKAFDAGIVKRFRGSVKQGNHDVELFFYRDANANNRYDPWEPPMAEVLVKVGNEVLLSGKDGRVVYRGLPAGIYPVQVLQARGAYAESRTILVNGRTRLDVPLHAIGTINGRVKLDEDETGMPAFTVKATGRNGKVYTALTNEQGAFVFFLPHDVYRLQVEPGARFTSAEPAVTVELRMDKAVQVSFELHHRPREVKVKKFYSVR